MLGFNKENKMSLQFIKNMHLWLTMPMVFSKALIWLRLYPD